MTLNFQTENNVFSPYCSLLFNFILKLQSCRATGKPILAFFILLFLDHVVITDNITRRKIYYNSRQTGTNFGCVTTCTIVVIQLAWYVTRIMYYNIFLSYTIALIHTHTCILCLYRVVSRSYTLIAISPSEIIKCKILFFFYT